MHMLPDVRVGEPGIAQTAPTSLVMYGEGEATGDAPREYEGHKARLLWRLDHQLAAAQREFAQLQAEAGSKLARLERCVKLLADVHQVSVSGAAIPPSAAGLDGADARIFLVFGAVRVASHSAQFEVHDVVVDDLDIELWEASGTRLLGHCCVSVHPLLVKEQVTIDAALPLTSAGGLVVGTVRVHIEAS